MLSPLWDKYTLKGFRMESQKRKIRNQGMAPKAVRHSPMRGVVISRKCSSCGHREVGIISEAEDFIALKPRIKITVLQGGKED